MLKGEIKKEAELIEQCKVYILFQQSLDMVTTEFICLFSVFHTVKWHINCINCISTDWII